MNQHQMITLSMISMMSIMYICPFNSMSKTSEVQLMLKKTHITRFQSDHILAVKRAVYQEVENKVEIHMISPSLPLN